MLQPKRKEKPKNVTFSDTSPSRLNRKYVAPQITFRRCTLVKTVPDTILNMPTQTDSIAQLKKKQEVALVSDKVTKTKNEIEQLKAELEQLISRGITETTSKLKATTSEESIRSERLVTDIKAKAFKDNIADILHNPNADTLKIVVPITKPKSITVPEVQQPKKVRHYDQDVAREYIKRQREKRREELLNKKKEGVSSVDLKKQRLQELREKSLKLLSKNVNRARSRSRERKEEPLPPQIEHVSSHVSEVKPIHPQLQNITLRSPLTFNVDEPFQENAKADKNKAAVKIQALFRGYRQRQLMKEARKEEQLKELICKEVQTSLRELPKPISVPYPYNFINAVRRKLNLVTQQVKANSSVVLDSPVRKSPDLKSFLSDKCLNLDVKSIEHLTLRKSNTISKTGVENGCASESDTSKNIPDLSSESSATVNLLHSSKRRHSSDTDDERKLSINTEGVKKLKLRQPKSIESEISERINGSKESIISYNSCNYGANKKSEISIKNTPPIEEDLDTIASKTNKIETDTVPTEKNITDEMQNTASTKGETYNLENKENELPIPSIIEKRSATQEYSSSFASVASEMPALQPPSVSLKTSLPISSSEETDRNLNSNRIASITLRPGEKSFVDGKVKANEIHLKFEAELHLLNDFNDSLRQVMAVEKSLLELHNKKNEAAMSFHTRDTQTSFTNPQNHIAKINYSRGSEVTEALSIDNDVTLITTGLELSQFNSPVEESCSDYSVVKAKPNGSDTFAGLSIEMFERLIKDEDARIENLKAILKIREKALVDRTKGELAWLEIQKKHLKDGGQLQEISAIKKKQRGLLIKLEHERHEMQRLKQMQKAASKERKSVLKEQRNMIKAQLSTGGTVTKLKRHAKEEKRPSGPVKVYNIKSHSDTVFSETSMTRRSSITEEVVSELSHRSHSIISQISEEFILSEKLEIQTNHKSTIQTETVKRSLLMREAALQKRRKVAEEILQWHQRLLEEEKKISELELAATSIINQASPVKSENLDKTLRQKFKGSQLNQLWLSMTGRQEKKFKDEEVYNMSQASLEKFCRNAKHYEKLQKRNRTSDSRHSSINLEENRSSEYVSDFESAVTSDSATVNGRLEESSDSDQIRTVTEISKQKTDQKSSEEKVPSDKSFQGSDTGNYIEEHPSNSRESVDNIRISIKENQSDEIHSLDLQTITNGDDRQKEQLKKTHSVIETALHGDDNISDQHVSDEAKGKLSNVSNCDLESNSKELSENLIEQDGDDPNLPSDTHKTTSTISEMLSRINMERGTSVVDFQSSVFSDMNQISQINELFSINEPTDQSRDKVVSSNIHTERGTSNQTENGSQIKELSSINEATNQSRDKVVSSSINTERGTSSQTENSSQIKELLSINEATDQTRDKVVSSNVNTERGTSNQPGNASQIKDLHSINETTDQSRDKMVSSNIYTERGTSNQTENASQIEDLPSIHEATDQSKDKMVSSNINTERGTSNQTENGLKCELIQNITNKELTNNSEEDCDLNNKVVTESLLNNIDVKITNSNNDDGSSNDSQQHSKTLSTENLDKIVSPSQTIDSISEIEEDQVSDLGSVTNNQRLTDKLDEVPLASNDEETSKINEELDALNISTEVNDRKLGETFISEALSEAENDLSDQIIAVGDRMDIQEAIEVSKNETVDVTSVKDNHEESSNKSVEEQILINEESSSETTSRTKPCSPLLSSYGFIDVKEASQSDTVESTGNLDGSGRLEGASKKVDCDSVQSDNKDKIGENDSNASLLEQQSSTINESIHTADSKNSSCVSLEADKNIENSLSIASDRNISEKTTDEKQIDVKKRVLEILSDANISSPRGDRSPRMQDFYVTAYDVTSPNSTSPTEDVQSSYVAQNVTDEVEELLKKQIAIEREIKEIQQQQKEHLPYLYVREIPNKPPPPYTPPSTKQHTPTKDSILPIGDSQVDIITKATSEILHRAFKENNLRNITLSENAKKILDLKHNISADCYEFLFDLSKEIAIDHYKQFEPETGPSWMHLRKQTKLAIGLPLDQCGLNKLINKKVKQVLGFEVVKAVENKKHKWSGKKRDHVDDLLVVECQAEETEWTNYDRDELVVKDELTKEILNMLLSETGQVLNDILKKKNSS